MAFLALLVGSIVFATLFYTGVWQPTEEHPIKPGSLGLWALIGIPVFGWCLFTELRQSRSGRRG